MFLADRIRKKSVFSDLTHPESIVSHLVVPDMYSFLVLQTCTSPASLAVSVCCSTHIVCVSQCQLTEFPVF